MPLVEHLAELRRRLIISAIAIGAGGIVAFFLYNWILGLLIEPYTDITGKTQLVFTDPLEGFTTRLKLAAYGGLFLASPVVLWQFWRFVTPGLHKNEKRFAIPFVLASLGLFLLGATVALLTFEPALSFLIGVAGPNLESFFTASKYLSLVMLMMLAFGIAFEFPSPSSFRSCWCSSSSRVWSPASACASGADRRWS
jgi:sec-independent protein translocase protein TatC